MNAEQATKLRAPFAPETIGKLPRLTCKACQESRTKNCSEHKKDRCRECGNWISSAHIHLDYVGHAATTDRLLQVDPAWTWEPLGVDDAGRPAVVSGLGDSNEPIGIWIKLTVCGVTRPGFGSGKSAKEAIGDAIRNAAMRFGVALDLWAKEDLQSGAGPAPADTGGQNGERTDGPSADGADDSPPAPEPFFQAPTGPRGGKVDALEVKELADELRGLVRELGATDSLAKVDEKEAEGDGAWLKRQITTAKKALKAKAAA